MIKELTIAVMLGTILIYEFLVLVNIQRFVSLTYGSPEFRTPHDKRILATLALFNFIYFVFIVACTAFGTQWHMYGALFLLSVIGSPIIHYFKRKDNRKMIILIKLIDTLVSIVLVTQIFFNHFHN